MSKMSELAIRKAVLDEYDLVQAFYDDLIDHIDDFEYGPMWQKGIYPAYEYLRESIAAGNLYIGLLDGQIVAAMIVNTESNESYEVARWQVDLPAGEYVVIHALGVLPTFVKQGLGRQMVAYVQEEIAPAYQAIRLDVLKGNQSANLLYEAAGFEQCDTIQMYYEDTGWTDFEMYEWRRE